jgi:dipeptidyl aminopeptidase/acylaminoacyl peptidase
MKGLPMAVCGTIRFCLLLFMSGSVVFPVLASAAGSQSDDRRAETLSRRFRNKVFGQTLTPNWSADGSRFWYRYEKGPDRHEFVLVDTLAGIRRTAFDHDRLARALSQALSRDFNAQTLPLKKLQFDTDKPLFTFTAEGFLWLCDLDTYQLEQLGPVQEKSLPPMDAGWALRGSLRTGEETQLTFINRTEKEVELFWLDSSGTRHSYGILAPGQEHQQHTYAGHVWLAAEKGGSDLAFYVAPEQEARILIGVDTSREAVPVEEVRRRRPFERPERAVCPDGSRRAFIRDYNLWLAHTQDGGEVQLTTDGRADNAYTNELAWSPDSKKLAVMRQKPAQEHKVHFVESSPKEQLEPKLHSIDYLKPGDQVAVERPYLFDIETQKSIPVSDELFANPYSIFDLRWQKDSSRFTFVYNQRGHQVLRVVGVNAVTGQASSMIDEKSDTFICYSGKYYCEFLNGDNSILWMSERDGYNHLYLYDVQTGRATQVTKGPWVVRSVERVLGGKVWFYAGGIYPSQDPYYLHYARVNLDGTGLTVLTEGDGTHTVQFSPDRRCFIDTWSRVNQPPVHELRRSSDGKRLCMLEQADSSALIEAGWQSPEPFVAKGRDGRTDIYGIIIRPTVFDPNQRYPVIENIYAGPQDSFVPKSFRAIYGMMELAELGFIVVQIDGMGTSNRSKAFHDVCWKNLSDAGLPDRILWMKAAAQKYPYMDVSRVGIYGTSAGGQSAAAAVMTHGDFYKAAVADSGCHDNRMDKIWWNEQWMGWPVGPEYEANSNLTLAAGLTGKLLLIAGEMDTNVDPASTMQLAGALIRANKDFEMLIIPGAGHGAGDSPYGIRRRNDFFIRHLLNAEPGRE